VAFGKQQRGRVRNPGLRTLGLCEKLHAAALKRGWNLRDLFLSGLLPLRYVRIALTPDTVRLAHRAAIVEVVKRASGSYMCLRFCPPGYCSSHQ